MATISSEKQPIPKAFLQKLAGMRGKLTRWIMVYGLSRWLLVALGILAADMALDRLFKMDLAQRLVMLVVMAAIAIVYFFWKVIKPLGARPNDDALIYEVESKNPGLQESLLSGVQLSREKDLVAQGVSLQLAEATIQQSLEDVQAIDFGQALDLQSHLRNWMLLICGLVISGGLAWGVTNSQFLKTWFNRNILLLEDQWPQSTYLEIAGVENGKLILPRGVDHRQLVTVTQDSQIKDVTLSLEIDNPGGRTIHQMKPTGKLEGREHVFMFHNVSSKFRFRASGGDDTTSWVDVELVEPPNIIELSVQALLPEYTGVESVAYTGMGPHSVLLGSKLKVDIRTNKPLSEAELKLGEESFAMSKTGGDTSFGLTIPAGDGQLSGGEYEFELVDPTGLKSSRRSKFKIAIKEDEAPKVRANLWGISGLVSSRAILPTSYQAADEYGLRNAAFDCNWKVADDDASGQREVLIAEFGKQEDGSPTRKVKQDAALDLVDLNLKPGTSFRFTVAAFDSFPTAPKVGRSQEFLLRVVTDEELRADLLRREIEQRKAFDQAYQIQMELATEIQAVAARRVAPGTSKDDFDSQREAAFIELVRNQKGIGTAIDRVANRFEDFLVEVKNNRLDEAENAADLGDDQRIEVRFDQRIIQPIRQLDTELISLATRHMDNCRRAVAAEDELGAAVETTVEVQLLILEEMKRILSAMNDSENFQEVINDLLEIKEKAAGVQSGIEKAMKPKDVFEGDDGIFENDKKN